MAVVTYLALCSAWIGPSLLNSLSMRTLRTPELQCSAAGGAQALDKLIAELRKATPEQMPQLLAANMKAIDQRLFLRLAEMSDEENDEFEKLRIRQLATAVTTTLEELIKKADAQLNRDATIVQDLLRVMASSDGQFEVPVPQENVRAVRAEIRSRLAELDEGFVATTKAYMQKASDDRLDGMVAVLRELLQSYAAEQLVVLVRGRLDQRLREVVVGILEAPPDSWASEMRKLLNSSDAECTVDELVSCLQDQMGEVVLAMPAGSSAQSVLAEYLSELLSCARTVAAEDA